MSRSKTHNREAEWFGYRKVHPEAKAGLVGEVFSSVAPQYDLMNDLMSGGIHRIWKNRLVRLMRPRPGKSLLDLAGGTGDVAFRYHRRAGEDAAITVCDINPAMLAVGRAKAVDKGYLKNINWVEGDAQDLPFENSTFDCCSISFGLRNVPRIDDALREAHRVLKPGSEFFCLEFSKIKSMLLEKLYEQYSFRVIPRLGDIITGDSESYQYLVESIRKFPGQEDLSSRMRDAGFDRVQVVNLSGGIAAIHVGLKA